MAVIGMINYLHHSGVGCAPGGNRRRCHIKMQEMHRPGFAVAFTRALDIAFGPRADKLTSDVERNLILDSAARTMELVAQHFIGDFEK